MILIQCGTHNGRRYKIRAELDEKGRIISFAAKFCPEKKTKDLLWIVPEKPVPTSKSPRNIQGKKLLMAFREFLSNPAENSTTFH